MTRYLIVSDLSAADAKAVAEAGLAARRSYLSDWAKSLGGSLEGYWATLTAGRFVALLDLPVSAAQLAAGGLVQAAAGTKAEAIVLVEAEDVDSARTNIGGYATPGDK